MMSLLRIVFGLLAGIGILVGVAFLAKQFPVAAGRLWFMTLGLGIGSLLLWVVRYSLQSGVSGGRHSRYYRSDAVAYRGGLRRYSTGIVRPE